MRTTTRIILYQCIFWSRVEKPIFPEVSEGSIIG